MSVITSIKRLFFVIATFSCLLLPFSAHAISFSPTTADLNVLPGETTSQTFTLMNNSDDSKKYTADLNVVYFDEDNHEPIFSAWPASLTSLITLDNSGLALGPRQQATITLSVQPPKEYPDSALSVALIIRETSLSGNVKISSGISSLIFITIGHPSVDPEVASFKATPVFGSSLPIDFISEITNNGTRTLQPYGTITVYNIFSNRVATLDLNPTLHRVPTGQSRSLETSWGTARTTGNFIQELWREVTNPMIGYFTAELLAAPYPDGPATLTRTAHIIVLPWRALSIIFGLGATLTVLVRRRRR